jgi:hypothetical protein
MAKHRWQSYAFVQAWEQRMGAFQYHQRMAMQKAAMAGAPVDACFQQVTETGLQWVTVGELSEELREEVTRLAEECRRAGPPA